MLLLLGPLAGGADARPQGPVVAMRLAPRKRSTVRAPAPGTPTAALPRRWDLPQGWNTAVRELPEGGVVEYVSGLDARIWARVYSWPTTSPWASAQDARSRFGRAFDQKAILSRSTHQGDEIHMTLFGFTDEQKVKQPDIMMKVRTARNGDRLMAVVVGVLRPEDPKARPEDEADELLARLHWEDAPRLRWGAGGL